MIFKDFLNKMNESEEEWDEDEKKFFMHDIVDSYLSDQNRAEYWNPFIKTF